MASASNTDHAVAHDLRVHQAAVVFLVLAGQHRDQRGLVVVERNVGDEAEPAAVDADQRNAVAGELPADAEHGAVAADHQAEVAALADFLDRQRLVARERRGAVVGVVFLACRALDEHLATLRFEEGADALPSRRRAHPPVRGRRKPGICRSGRRDESGKSFSQITTLKSCNAGRPCQVAAQDARRALHRRRATRRVAHALAFAGLDLSPATIRNVMSDLEALGLIASPHTSAGRIPTHRGYRLFVDTMLTAQREQMSTPSLAPDQPQKVIANAATCCRTCRSSSAW
jgi:hypothetical protein